MFVVWLLGIRIQRDACHHDISLDSYRMYHVQLELFLYFVYQPAVSNSVICINIECLVITFLYLVLATNFFATLKNNIGVFFTMEIGIVLAYVQKKPAVWMNVFIYIYGCV